MFASVILFVIGVACGFCVGRSRMSARSRRVCIGLDRHSTFWWSRSTIGSRVLRAVPRVSVPGHQSGLHPDLDDLASPVKELAAQSPRDVGR